MSLISEFQQKLLVRSFNQLVAGMDKVTVQRKLDKANTGPEIEHEWKDVYKNLDSNLQCLRSLTTTEFGIIPTGVADLTKSVCFVPMQIQEQHKTTEIVIKTDDRLIIGGETYRVLRVNKYPSHQELICEPEET